MLRAGSSRRRLIQHDDSEEEEEKEGAVEEEEDNEEAAEGGTFVVSTIAGCKLLSGVLHYKVKWAGYGPEHDSWEPASTLDEDVPQLLADYHRLVLEGGGSRVSEGALAPRAGAASRIEEEEEDDDDDDEEEEEEEEEERKEKRLPREEMARGEPHHRFAPPSHLFKNV